MEFTTSNTGKSVKINPAPFKLAINLKKEILKCFKQAGVTDDLDFEKVKSISKEKLFSAISDLMITIDTSEGFENAVFDCLSSCIYDNKHAITPQLFDDIPELQEDYYEIIIKCCEVNLRPFFKSLYSELGTRFNLSGESIQTPELEQMLNL